MLASSEGDIREAGTWRSKPCTVPSQGQLKWYVSRSVHEVCGSVCI